MKRNTEAKCGNCPYGEERNDDPLSIDCHRYPPQYVGDEEHPDGQYCVYRFPSHSYASYCGEHPNFWE